MPSASYLVGIKPMTIKDIFEYIVLAVVLALCIAFMIRKGRSKFRLSDKNGCNGCTECDGANVTFIDEESCKERNGRQSTLN